MRAKAVSVQVRQVGSGTARVARRMRLAFFRHRQRAWVPSHLHRDIMDDSV